MDEDTDRQEIETLSSMRASAEIKAVVGAVLMARNFVRARKTEGDNKPFEEWSLDDIMRNLGLK